MKPFSNILTSQLKSFFLIIQNLVTVILLERLSKFDVGHHVRNVVTIGRLQHGEV